MKLRDYQEHSITELYRWLEKNSGHPCVVLPTGAGKSVVIAELVRQVLQGWHETKVLMLCHQKELLEQNAQKMRTIWPNAPMGIYSASVGKKQLGEPILFAGIQSIRNKARLVGHIDICIVDECHCISHKEEGGYRKFISDLLAINPSMRVVGYSATPYRLGQGKLTDGDTAIFSDLVEPVTVKELVERGFLAPLKSKHTTAMIDTSKVKKRGGEYIAGQLQGAADAITAEAISEIIDRAEDRRHWLLFCAGVAHAQHCADELNSRGIPAGCLDGTASKGERERILSDFTSGKLKALTNCDILTTGFDFPDIDLIAFLRPTMSPALYVQMAGRGMRLKSHTDHCLVLDFAGNVERHGPIVNVEPPKPAGKGGGEAPAKTCPQCDELLHTSCMICPECGHEFPKREKELKLSNADIMGIEPERIEITDWRWSRHVSRKTGKEMVKVKYYSGLTGPVIDEYFCVTHEGIAGMKARAAVQRIAEKAAVIGEPTAECMDTLAGVLNTGKPPSAIEYRKNGKFYDVQDRIWTI